MRITKNIERWFDVPNDPDKARLKIRQLTPGEQSDIIEEVYKSDIAYKKTNGGTFEPSFSQKIDRKKERELTYAKAITDWEHFFDLKDKPMKCTIDNILRASRKIEGFDELVTELRAKLDEDLKQEKEDQRKNSMSSASESVK